MLWIGSAILWTWATLALLTFPAWPSWFRLIAALAWIAGSVSVVRKVPREKLPVVVLAGVLFVRIAWGFNSPSNDRDWVDFAKPLATATFDGDLVRINNLRNAIWKSDSDYQLRWETREYDLREIQSVDFVVVPFAMGRALAHVFVSFGFANGEYVAISVEVRKEKDEVYSPLRGMFRHYEIAYIVGDERDLIGLRANVWNEPVHLYPIKATPAQARSAFVSMLERANSLRAKPRFYNTLLHNCTTTVLNHANDLRQDKVSAWNWRIVLPGYSDGLVQELGLLDFDGSIEEARDRFLINDRAGAQADARAWSRHIRQTPVR